MDDSQGPEFAYDLGNSFFNKNGFFPQSLGVIHLVRTQNIPEN